MRALHLTSHVGTMKNIENVFKCLTIEHKLSTQRCIHTGLYYNEKTANDIWEYYSDKLEGISVLLFTDTSMIARPFLQNIEKHNCLVVVYITNRFDWGIWGFRDDAYYNLYADSSTHNRVIFCADNNYDQHYAMTRDIKFVYEDSIKLTPKISNNMILPNTTKFFIYNRGTKFNNYEHCLKTRNIAYDVYGEGFDRFKNNESICEYKGFIHLPYQTNIQSLWENWGHFIMYFIPSKSFITELITQDNSWYYWEEKHRNYELLMKSIGLSEWYNEDHRELFEYFESWDDLKYKVETMTDEYIRNKKRNIKSFIETSNVANVNKWKTILKMLVDP